MNTIETEAGTFEVSTPLFADEPAPVVKVPAGSDLTLKRAYWLRILEIYSETPDLPGQMFVRGQVLRGDGRPARAGHRATFLNLDLIEES